MASNLLGPTPGQVGLVVALHHAHDAQERVLARTGYTLERTIKVVLSQPGTGRMYGTHRASAPGEPPAVETGHLRQSVQYTHEGGDHRVGTDAPYAPPLEYGTSKMAPRPFMRPGLEAARRELPAELLAGATLHGGTGGGPAGVG